MEIGLMPRPESSRMSQSKLSRRNSRSFFTSGVPACSSLPAYTSSVFSRKMTMSIFSGAFTGEGTPWNQRTGRRQT